MKPKLLLLLPLLLSSCFIGDDFDSEKITGRYYVLGNGPNLGERDWHDAMLYFDDEDSGYGEPIIPRNISAVWYNEDFIVAETSTLIATRQTERVEHQYYLVPVWRGKHYFQATKMIEGPLDRRACYKELERVNGDTLLPEARRFTTLNAHNFHKL